MSKEAMKLALEALESCDAAHITDGGHQWYDEKLVDTAYAALREALAEQPAQQEPVGTYQEIMRTMIALKTGTVVQQQAYELMKDKQLYTSPPAQRTWVGLTDDEIEKTYETKVWDARRSYARAIEAKLKEKNT